MHGFNESLKVKFLFGANAIANKAHKHDRNLACDHIILRIFCLMMSSFVVTQIVIFFL